MGVWPIVVVLLMALEVDVGVEGAVVKAQTRIALGGRDAKNRFCYFVEGLGFGHSFLQM
jgi:hypothetical protein